MAKIELDPKEIEQNLGFLTSIYNKYSPSPEDYERIKQSCAKKLFSKSQNLATYGMFYPYEEMTKFFKYYGKGVSENEPYDNEYFFDENGRLLLTRHFFADKSVLSFTLYFYYDSYVDAVWYDTKYGYNMIARYEKKNGVLTRYIEGDCVKDGTVFGYNEYVFPPEKGERISYSSFAKGVGFDGRDYISKSTFVVLCDGAR